MIAEGGYYYNLFREPGLLEMAQSGTPRIVTFTIIVTVETHWLNSEVEQGGKAQRMIGQAYGNPLVKLYEYWDMQAPTQCARYRTSKISQSGGRTAITIPSG